MHALEKRIASLEQANTQADTFVFIFFVGMGETNIHRKPIHIYDSHDNHWRRRPSETEHEFKDRSTAETPHKENNVTLLFGDCVFNA